MNSEILRLVDTIHRDKDIDKEIIFEGVEQCIETAVRRKLGEECDVRVAIDRESGETTVYQDGEEIPISDLGRLAALQGKQVLLQKIREAERDRIFDEYEAKIGKLVTGVVQRIEGPNLIINLGGGRVEGILPRSEQAPGERFRVGERIKVLLADVRKNHRVRITLSRGHPDLVRALFELEVPEIAEKVIEIMNIVREPGYRTKIAVTTYDRNVDCVGACVGVRGSRIKNIVDELFGERIDIVRWNESIEVLIMNALQPAEITTMDLDYDEKRAAVYVRPDMQSIAIGKRGQNVRLASKLSGWELDIVTVSEEDIERLRKGEMPIQPAADGETAAEAPAEGAAADAAEGTESAAPVDETGEAAIRSEDGGTEDGDAGAPAQAGESPAATLPSSEEGDGAATSESDASSDAEPAVASGDASESSPPGDAATETVDGEVGADGEEPRPDEPSEEAGESESETSPEESPNAEEEDAAEELRR